MHLANVMRRFITDRSNDQPYVSLNYGHAPSMSNNGLVIDGYLDVTPEEAEVIYRLQRASEPE